MRKKGMVVNPVVLKPSLKHIPQITLILCAGLIKDRTNHHPPPAYNHRSLVSSLNYSTRVSKLLVSRRIPEDLRRGVR